jgi:MOSC domain-containing protein YiiM
VGLPQIIGTRGGIAVYSSIKKKVVGEQEILVTPTGLAGDQQVETGFKPNGGQLHGGHEMAIYAYPQEHYRSYWRYHAPFCISGRGPGVGENLLIRGATEHEVYIGDVWDWDGVQLKVSKPRTPCFKLDMVHEGTNVREQMRLSGLTGWYLMVIEPGVARTDTELKLIHREPDAESVLQQFLIKNPVTVH